MIFSKKTPQSKLSINDCLDKLKRNDKSIYLLPTNKVEILNIINLLKLKKSSGWDRISNILLKQLAHVLVNPLCIVFNRSISSGVFPDIFKAADVTPLYKNGAQNETTNYRPISLVVTISGPRKINS